MADEPAPESPATAEADAGNGREPKPSKSLPTERIGFDKQLDILRASAVASAGGTKVVSNQEIAEIVQLKAATVSLANPFFQDVGLLEKVDNGLRPAKEVVSFQRAWEWNQETAANKLAPLLERSWFGKAVLPRVSFRDLPRREAVAILAEAAGATPKYEPRLQLLLDYLQAGGLVVLEGDLVRRSTPQQSAATPPTEEKETETPKEKTATPKAPRGSAVSTTFVQPTEGAVNFHVTVKVDMAEFSGWRADRIAAFFGGIAQVLAAKSALEKEAAES